MLNHHKLLFKGGFCYRVQRLAFEAAISTSRMIIMLNAYRVYFAYIDIDDCTPGSCNLHGQCEDYVEGVLCDCEQHYEGEFCEVGE